LRLKVKDAMSSKLVTASPSQTLRQIQNLMKENGITGVPIVQATRIIGIVSVDDIMNALDNGYIEDAAEKHMSRSLIVLEDDMPLSFGVKFLEKYRFGRFPVVTKKGELVGIITSRDIVTCLLIEVNQEIQKLESQVPHKDIDLNGEITKEFHTHRYDFETAGTASTQIKKILKTRSIDPNLIRRISVASYELEINQVVHTNEGGRMIFHIKDNSVTIRAVDNGPGIPDIEKAMEEGYSTATDWIRSLGFGAGMGLPNIKRVSDEFHIQSKPGLGSEITAIINLK
jgi:CBS domain-containing protein/anti-sigma regulatory factor (Ser/Thr protein kinase)